MTATAAPPPDGRIPVELLDDYPGPGLQVWIAGHPAATLRTAGDARGWREHFRHAGDALAGSPLWRQAMNEAAITCAAVVPSLPAEPEHRP